MEAAVPSPKPQPAPAPSQQNGLDVGVCCCAVLTWRVACVAWRVWRMGWRVCGGVGCGVQLESLEDFELREIAPKVARDPLPRCAHRLTSIQPAQ